jgi:hypothetical protein
MKLTESQLKEIISEEIEAMIEEGDLDEGFLDRLKARYRGATSGVGDKLRGAATGALGKVAGLADKETGDFAAGRAGALKQQAAEKAKAARVMSILMSHFDDLENDLKKLDIPVKGELGQAMSRLKTQIRSSAGTLGKDDVAQKYAAKRKREE